METMQRAGSVGVRGAGGCYCVQGAQGGRLWSGNIRRDLKKARGEPWRELGEECSGKWGGEADAG